MYHVIALVYVLVAGQLVNNEPLKITHKQVFEHFAECKDFLDSNDLAAQKQVLGAMVANAYKARTPGEDPDGAAVPAITITASCEEDNSL